MAQRSTSELYDNIQNSIRDIVKSHLKIRAVSHSSHEAKQTGNAYQAVRLGDEVIPGFRSAQRDVFAGVNLKGKTVLDLGSNLGEVARDAGRAGAGHVLGVEYDRYFVQMARLIAAHDDLSNVSFVQGDLTDPNTYRGRHDVVVALSVFTYINDFIDKIAAITGELLIIETHAVKGNWHKQYVQPLKRHFPYVALVGVSDHRAASKSEWRYLLFCSHKPLEGILATRARELASSAGLLTLDLSRSTVRHLDTVLEKMGLTRPCSIEDALAAAARFVGSTSAEEQFQRIPKIGVVRSPIYWCNFLIGYGEYRARGEMDRNNAYYRLLTELVERGMYDQAFRGTLARPDGGIPRLVKRYKIIDDMLENRDDGASLEPILLYNILEREYFPKAGPSYELFVDEIGEKVYPLGLDGHHRMFAGYIAGACRLRMVPMWYEHVAMPYVDRRPHARKELWRSVYPFSEKLGGSEGKPQVAGNGIMVAGE